MIFDKHYDIRKTHTAFVRHVSRTRVFSKNQWTQSKSDSHRGAFQSLMTSFRYTFICFVSIQLKFLCVGERRHLKQHTLVQVQLAPTASADLKVFEVYMNV